MLPRLSTPVENAGSAAIDTICYNGDMATANRLNEGKANRDKDEFDKNFDAVKFPKKKGTSAEEKEKRRKDWLRMILLDDAGDYPELEDDVEKAYERCKGLDY
jgi:hypothetical protein